MSSTVSPEKFKELEKQIEATVAVEEARVGPAPKGTVVCISAFNDEERIGKTVAHALRYCDKVIVCDDGSSDETAAKARAAGAFVIKHEEGLGKGKTTSDLVEEAIKHEPGVVVVMDMDAYGQVDNIPALLGPIVGNEADIAVGVDEGAGLDAVKTGLLALNSKALSARSKEGFFSDLGSSDQMATAAASGLRFKVVTFGPKVIPPPAIPKPKEPLNVRLKAKWERAVHTIVMERPFFFIGAPGIELTVAGLALIVYFLYVYNYAGYLNLPLGVVGAVALFFGVAFIISYTLVYAIKHAQRTKETGQ